MTRRADPSEARARELAIAAGVDPDGRVPKPGSQRGMPAWCTFRDAARAELNAREARETAATIVNLRPQAAGVSEQPAHGDRRARRRDHRADAQLHGGRQRRGRRALRRRPSRLRAAGRRRHRLRGADQHLRRRLRHRLRQHGGAARHAATAPSRTASRPILDDVAQGHLVRRRPHQRSERVEHDLFDDADAWREADMRGIPPEGAPRSSAPSAPATTTST